MTINEINLTAGDYNRLFDLSYRANRNQVTFAERDELISLLFKTGKISPSQYDQYQSGRDIEGITRYGISVAAILLLGKVIADLVKSR
jgi:hypothetical protein